MRKYFTFLLSFLLFASLSEAQLAKRAMLVTGGSFAGGVNWSGYTGLGLRLPILTTTQRDATSPAAGDFIYNSTLSQIQYYNGSSWITPGSGGGGGVSSVALDVSALGFSVVGSPITSSGTFTVAGVLDADNGGTGQSSYTVGDILYASSTTALSKLSGVATGNALVAGGVSTAPSWGKIGLTTHVSGTLDESNGGTGNTSYTTGDLLYASNSSTLSPLNDVATGNVLISGGAGVAPSWGKVGMTTHISGQVPEANGGTGVTSLASLTSNMGWSSTTIPGLRVNTVTTAQEAGLSLSNGHLWYNSDLGRFRARIGGTTYSLLSSANAIGMQGTANWIQTFHTTQDSTKDAFYYDFTNKTLALGFSPSTTPSGLISSARIHMVNESTGSLETVMDGAAGTPQYVGRRSAGTFGSRTATGSGEGLVSLQGRGHDGSAFTTVRAEMIAKSSQAFTSSNQGARWEVWTTDNGSTAMQKSAQFVNGEGVTLYDVASGTGITLDPPTSLGASSTINLPASDTVWTWKMPAVLDSKGYAFFEGDPTGGTDTLTIYQVTVPADALGGATNRSLRVTIFGSMENHQTGGGKQFTPIIKYGSTILFQDQANTIGNGSHTSRYPFYIDFTLANNNGASAQALGGTLTIADSSGFTTGYGNLAVDENITFGAFGGNSAENSGVQHTLRVMMIPSAESDSVFIRRQYAKAVLE